MIELSPLLITQLDSILPIEQACHPFPTSAKVLASCFSKRYHNFKLTRGTQVIGFYMAELVIDELTLHNICISPDHQGKGYGQQLLQHFLASAKVLGAVQLWLEVRESNTSAIALYQNHGFDVAGKRHGYYPAKNGREDALLMGCSLMFG